MSNILMTIITLLCGFLVVYHHLVYPLVLSWMTKQRPNKQHNRRSRQYTSSDLDDDLPQITIVMPAYNEQQWIADKIRNLASLDYPADKLKVLLACDGCSDDTVAIAEDVAKEAECAQLALTIINFPHNRGKVAVINQVVAQVVNPSSEPSADQSAQVESDALIALSDVSALISIDALLIAAEHFKDPQLGVLNGHYRLLTPESVGEAAYWRYQSKIKSREAALGATLGAHGAFYLFRGALFVPLASDTINDDFVLPMKIVAAGYRADYDELINALELENAAAAQDYQRRRRIAAGNLQQLLRLSCLLLPRYKGTAFTFFSGKGLRVFMPFLMVLCLVGCLLLANQRLFFILTVLQLLAYGAGLIELLFHPTKSPKICKLLAYLIKGHVAGFHGVLRYVFAENKKPWRKLTH